MIEPSAIHHIGIAVRSIDAHRAYYEETLGARFEGIETMPEHGVRVAFFAIGPRGHAVRLELVEPLSAETPIARFIDKRGEGLHHVAYAVDDIRGRLERLRAAGLRLIDETPRPGAHQTLIGFLHPESTGGVLTELCQPADRPDHP